MFLQVAFAVISRHPDIYIIHIYIYLVESNPGSKSGQIPPKGFLSGFYPNSCQETPKKSPKSLEVEKVDKITIFYIKAGNILKLR